MSRSSRRSFLSSRSLTARSSYTLTGPGAIPWSQVTAALSHALGHSIRYEAASVPGYMRHLRRRGLPWEAVLVQTTLHFLLRFGQGATYDPTLERRLGHPGRSLEQYIQDHAQLFTQKPKHGEH